MNWTPPNKPAEVTETRIIQAILDGNFAINSNLPGERELSEQLGVTRSTLREALQRLGRDGWIDIHQGKPTRVKNYWQEGNLSVLASIIQIQKNLPINFIPDLLIIRSLLAPTYTQLAVEKSSKELIDILSDQYLTLADESKVFANADWRLHQSLTIFSKNPVFTLILNGFRELYVYMGEQYFELSNNRDHSRKFYADLLTCALSHDSIEAEKLVRKVMLDSMRMWEKVSNPIS